jgi:hypothetical protein
MRIKLIALSTLTLLCAFQSLLSTARAQSTAFTYQGQLQDNGSLASGSYDLAFSLFKTNITGVPIAGPMTNSATLVSNGLFTATIDFGPGVFTGGSNWLEIAVSAHAANSFTTLAPRQHVTPTPYAITADNLTGTIPLSQLPANVLINGASGVNVSGTFSGNGAGLTNLNANVALLNATQTFTGQNNFMGIVGIGLTNSIVKLGVYSPYYGIAHTDGARILSTYLDAAGCWIGSYSNDPLNFYVNNGAQSMTVATNGNVGIGTTAPAYPLQMRSGAYCSAAGVWTSVSDRNVKEDFTAISPGDVLAKVAAMPITQWKYKVEPDGIKHIGPVAQDFHTAFGLGESDRAIGSVDESGVALAAIQGLNQKLEAENVELKRQGESLTARLNELEAVVRALADKK